MDYRIVGSDELAYGTMVMFPDPGYERQFEMFIRREMAFAGVKPHIYWARIENIRRSGPTIQFSTHDGDGFPFVKTAPIETLWVVKGAGVSEKEPVDAGALLRAMNKAIEERNAAEFEKAVDSIIRYAMESGKDDVEGKSFEQCKLEFIMPMVFTVLELK